MIAAVEVVVCQVKDLDCRSQNWRYQSHNQQIMGSGCNGVCFKQVKVFVSSVYPDRRHWLKRKRLRFGPQLCICADSLVQIGASSRSRLLGRTFHSTRLTVAKHLAIAIFTRPMRRVDRT
jgi:hypothetical protein